MASATINFTLPNQRTDNTALALTAIAFTRFTLSTNGGPFVQLVDIPAPTATTTLPNDLAPGSYVIRSVVYDKQVPARASSQVDTTVVVPAVLAAPKPVTGQTVVLS